MLVIDGGFRISASDDGTFETNRETFLLFTQCFHRMREWGGGGSGEKIIFYRYFVDIDRPLRIVAGLFH